ncbi:MAG: DUF3795 domain-containing protein [Anaerolineaceae bacterium]|nr:DUF3795 domain-containing protein [Anaerolineaceae bacterium]
MSEGMMIAYCGLVCTNCDGYLASQANNEAWKEQLAAKARAEYGVADASAESVTCDGCMSGARLGGYCSVCEIRACGSSRGVENCGTCPEFGTCARINKFMEMVPEVRETFASLR